MSKRLIGIEIGARTLRIAILNRDKGQSRVASLLERNYADETELEGHLQEVLTGEFRFGDQLATALPARSAYVRQLQFPFQEERKIAAAIPFELSSQLPVSVEDCATATQKTQPTDEGASIVTAAVPRDTLETLLRHFDNAATPLHRVDLAPFCYAAVLGVQIGDGILVCATSQETTVSLLQGGQQTEYRALPAITAGAAPAQFQALLREIKILAHAGGGENLVVSLMGDGVTAELEQGLQQAGYPVEQLVLNLGGESIESAFLPAVALALRAKPDRAERSFNFRQGAYALKGEWANLKKKGVLLVALLGLTLLVLAGSLTIRYIDKANQAEQLQVEMVNIYKSLFPNATTIVDVPMQLKSAILELQDKNNLITGNAPAALAVLKELSRLPEMVPIELQEFSMTPEALKLSGKTDSFESVNQISSFLEESPLFSSVQVADAKMSLDGKQINFRLSLSYAQQGGAL